MGQSVISPSPQAHPRPLPQAGGEIRDAAFRLAAVSDTPRLDAELLMAHALGVTREALLLGGMDGAAPDGFAALVERRMAHEPIAYITGRKAFWTIELEVGPGVLVPRPDSEVLIEACVRYFNPPQSSIGEGDHPQGGGGVSPRRPRNTTPPSFGRSPSPNKFGEDKTRILDLGTGSGALLLAALSEFPHATGLGIDASPEALAIARRNAERIAPGRAEIRLGNWAEDIDEAFDIILCNPPYIKDAADLPPDVRDHEPASALFAGPDGLDAYRTLIPQLPALLTPGGMIAVEIGHTQAEAVQALFAAQGLATEVRKDLAGRDRAVLHFALGKPVASA